MPFNRFKTIILEEMLKGHKIVDNVIYTLNVKNKIDERGVGWVYFENLLKYQDRVAQIDGLTGEEDTFGALLQRCIRAAIGLSAKGVQYGDVISVCTNNHLNSCVPHISAMFVGAKIAALDPSLSLSHAVHLFKIAMPKLIFVENNSVSLIEDVVKEIACQTIIITFDEMENYTSFAQLTKRTPEENQFQPVTVRNMNDVAVIMFSSGTTGLPKGICHTHYSMLSATSTDMKLGLAGAIIYASDGPYWNIFLFYLHHTILNGSTRMVYPKFHLDKLWNIFNRKITTAFLNITELMTLYYTEKPKSCDTNDLKIISTAGSPANAGQITKVKSLFPNTLVQVLYGQSEVFLNVFESDIFNSKYLEFLNEKMCLCGLPKSGVSYKIVDLESGKPLGPNQKGELRLKTEKQLSGYYNMNSDDIWDADGWLKTGDYGYYDEDYCFYIIDRIKEMFKYQYWHIVPATIENIVKKHPAVQNAIVIGVPHEVDEHHPMTIVQLKNNATATEDEIKEYVDNNVENRQKLRGGVKFVKDYPLTTSRKVNRWMLRQMVLQNNINFITPQ